MKIVVIDGADVLAAGPVHDRAAAVLRDAGSPTVLVSAADPAVAQGLLVEARRARAAVLDLSASSHPTEVLFS